MALRATPPGPGGHWSAGVGLWFVLDTLFSLAYGVLPNVVLNLIVFALFALPLAATRKDCLAPPSGRD